VRLVLEDPTLAGRFREARVLFFDCDGVLFDSNRFKQEALEAVMADYPAATHAPMRAYWDAHGGLSRYVKLRHYLEQIVAVRDADELERRLERALERFGEGSRAGYRRHDPLPEALRILQAAGAERCHVVSGTDQDELRAVFADKGLDRLVASVLGSPTPKHEHIARVLGEVGACPDQALFVGDGGGDFAASRATGVPLVFVARHSGWSGARAALEAAPEVVWADDLSQLARALGL